jgi:hypothetical protein
MDQDGGYSKQQIGSLTTEGEGESSTVYPNEHVWNIQKQLDLRVDGQTKKSSCFLLAIPSLRDD